MADIRDRTAQARLLQLPADTYTNLRPLDQDWQLYNYSPSGMDQFRGNAAWNPTQPGGRTAGPMGEGLDPSNWGDLLGLNESLLRERGYQGGLTGQEALPWLQANNLAVGQSGPLKDGLARHGNYYTQLFDTANGYAPIGTGYRTQNDYAEEGTGLATVALMALGGAALNGGFGTPTPAGGAAGGGAAGGGGLLGTEAVAPTLSAGSITGGSGLSAAQMAALQTPFQMTAPLTFGEAALAAGGGAAAAGGAGGGGGAGALGGSGAGGATAGGSGVWNPAIIDSAMNTAGYGANAQAAANMGTSLYGTGAQAGSFWDTLSNGASNWASDPNNWLKLAGAAAGAADAKDQTQTQSRDPWGPAQPYILEALQQGQKLNQQYQAQPFSPQQQTAYNNLGSLLNLANTNAPGLLSGFQANATGANNYDRSNPRKALLGSAPMQGNWNPGMLSFFPQTGKGG